MDIRILDSKSPSDVFELEPGSLTVLWSYEAREPTELDWRVLWYLLHVDEYLTSNSGVLRNLGCAADSDQPSSLWRKYFMISVAQVLENVGRTILGPEIRPGDDLAVILLRKHAVSSATLDLIELAWGDEIDKFRTWCTQNRPFKRRGT